MRRLTALLLALAAVLPAAAAEASRSQESLFQDDRNLLLSGEERRAATLDELRGLGVDVIRVNVVWNRYAPSPQAKRKPTFDATDPNAYRNLGELDALVSGAQSRGMSVLLTATGPGPAWASGCTGSANKRRICRPKPAEYGSFVAALGKRHPGVDRWSIWNEPNQGGWLAPQYVKRGKSWVRESPRIYRGLVRAATGALADTGHGGDEILLGETAPIGRTSGSHYSRTSAPADFYRDLFCLNSRGAKLSGRAAKIRGCSSYERLAVTGVAHHPYTSGAGRAPRSKPVGKGDITLSTISRLSLWLNRGARRGRIRSGLPIWLTEYGFQTNPPDRIAGTSLRNQARWLNESDWMAYGNGRIRSVGQYELRDERDRAAFQTGLRFVSGKAKPGLAAYRLPIWAVQTRSATKIWLQVRPQSRLEGPQEVTVQYRRKGATKWTTLREFQVGDSRGFFQTSTGIRAKYWRFSWNGQKSRTAAPASR